LEIFRMRASRSQRPLCLALPINVFVPMIGWYSKRSQRPASRAYRRTPRRDRRRIGGDALAFSASGHVRVRPGAHRRSRENAATNCGALACQYSPCRPGHGLPHTAARRAMSRRSGPASGSGATAGTRRPQEADWVASVAARVASATSALGERGFPPPVVFFAALRRLSCLGGRRVFFSRGHSVSSWVGGGVGSCPGSRPRPGQEI